MTKKQADLLVALFARRERAVELLAALASRNESHIAVSFYIKGVAQQFELDVSYVAARWTADLIDIERRIRAAGGTL